MSLACWDSQPLLLPSEGMPGVPVWPVGRMLVAHRSQYQVIKDPVATVTLLSSLCVPLSGHLLRGNQMLCSEDMDVTREKPRPLQTMSELGSGVPLPRKL